MAARLRIFLTAEEDRTLRELRQATTVPSRVKERAEAIRLNAKGWYVERIAAYLGCHITTVREALHRWLDKGLGGLWDLPKSTRQRSWSEEDMHCVENWLREEERTYNAKQLAHRLKEERGVEITPNHLRRILKMRGISWKRTRKSHRNNQDPNFKAVKQADLEMLELAAAAGEIDLLYADESGCSPWSEPGYSYYFSGEQKRQEQTKQQGKRLNILGFFQPLVTFLYGLVVGRVTSHTFIKLMNNQAQQAKLVFKESGRIRVIVVDNCSIHKSKAVKACLEAWAEQGLHLFFLPPYCSEMNPIELEWQHLKRDEIAGRMFEDETELADAIINGFEQRAEKHGHKVERFCFQNV